MQGSSKPLMGVRFPQGVLSDGDVDYRLGRSSFKAEDKVQFPVTLLYRLCGVMVCISHCQCEG